MEERLWCSRVSPLQPSTLFQHIEHALPVLDLVLAVFACLGVGFPQGALVGTQSAFDQIQGCFSTQMHR